VRQNTVPLNASFTKVQGMIEAPVLSYAQAEQAIGTLTQLSNSWPGSSGWGDTWNGSTNTYTPSGGPNYGPYAHTYTTASTTLEYDWQFQVNLTVTVPANGNAATVNSPTTQFSYLGNNRIYTKFPLDSATPNVCLILIIGMDWDLYDGNNGNYAIQAAFAQGDVTMNESTWTPVTPQLGTSNINFTGIINPTSPSFAKTLTFDLNIYPATGVTTLTMNAPPSATQQLIVYPSLSYNQWPNLNVLKVEVASGSGVAWTSQFSLVDTGSAISAVPTSADFAANASFLVAACHGSIYKIDTAGNVTQATGTYSLKTKTLVDMAFLSGVGTDGSSSGLNPGVFMVDGTNFVFLDVTTLIASSVYTFSHEGTIPTNCSLICNWRGRLILAQDSANPNNVYMSRVGNPTDYNYAALDPAAAVALQFSSAGQLGEPVMALIPFSDDYLIIGCLNSLWMCQGDPADGGTVVNISKSMGMTANNAWCIGPDGTLYFIARGGMYSVKPAWEFYRPPELMSFQTYDLYFRMIINGQYYLSMQFDVDNHYIHIFATSINEELTGTHMIYDIRNGGLWPQFYPHNYSPVSSTQFLGNAQNNRPSIMMGGFDGVIRYWTPTALDDDGIAISSFALLGPVKADAEAAMLSGVTIDMGEVFYANTATSVQQTSQEQDLPAQWNATATLFSGPDAFSVTEGAELGGAISPYFNNYASPALTTPHSVASIAMPLDRRQKTFRQRLRAGWHSLMISNSTLDTYWSFESASMEFMGAGRNRDRR
jgi:hypothetical protein